MFSLPPSSQNLGAKQTKILGRSVSLQTSIPQSPRPNTPAVSEAACVGAILNVHVLQHQPTDRAIEDRYSLHVLPSTETSGVKVIAGVYDGHRGPWAADHVSQTLPLRLADAISSHDGHHYQNVANATKPDDDTSAQSCVPGINLETVFEELDKEMMDDFRIRYPPPSTGPNFLGRIFRKKKYSTPANQTPKDGQDGYETAAAAAAQSAALRVLSGCTASVLFLNLNYDTPEEERTAQLINLGDSRTIIASLPSSQILGTTADVNATTPRERALVLSQHPTDNPADVFIGARLFGETLATRAFGDAMYKLPRGVMSTSLASGVLTKKEEELHKHFVSQLGAQETKARLSEGKAKILTCIEKYDAMFSCFKSPPYITSKPDVTTMGQTPPVLEPDGGHGQKSGLLSILATDGLWDLVGSEEAVRIVHDAWMAESDAGGGKINLAQRLFDDVVRQGKKVPGDDVTIMVLVLPSD